MKTIFIIEELWMGMSSMLLTDNKMFGYTRKGFVLTEEEAIDVVDKGKTLPADACWDFKKAMPQFRYRKIKLYERV